MRWKESDDCGCEDCSSSTGHSATKFYYNEQMSRSYQDKQRSGQFLFPKGKSKKSSKAKKTEYTKLGTVSVDQVRRFYNDHPFCQSKWNWHKHDVSPAIKHLHDEDHPLPKPIINTCVCDYNIPRTPVLFKKISASYANCVDTTCMHDKKCTARIMILTRRSREGIIACDVLGSGKHTDRFHPKLDQLPQCKLLKERLETLIESGSGNSDLQDFICREYNCHEDPFLDHRFDYSNEQLSQLRYRFNHKKN
ncbi:hypothetical protein AKO1_015778 [Acrasis kona]|uniref:Uncharacterized protein n=1 Tax=Acrasis kona TaxID=1008807 RepID=A0AAW2ZGR3_9EUKA